MFGSTSQRNGPRSTTTLEPPAPLCPGGRPVSDPSSDVDWGGAGPRVEVFFTQPGAASVFLDEGLIVLPEGGVDLARREVASMQVAVAACMNSQAPITALDGQPTGRMATIGESPLGTVGDSSVSMRTTGAGGFLDTLYAVKGDVMVALIMATDGSVKVADADIAKIGDAVRRRLDTL
jgi:hypothetical protein